MKELESISRCLWTIQMVSPVDISYTVAVAALAISLLSCHPTDPVSFTLKKLQKLGTTFCPSCAGLKWTWGTM